MPDIDEKLMALFGPRPAAKPSQAPASAPAPSASQSASTANFFAALAVAKAREEIKPIEAAPVPSAPFVVPGTIATRPSSATIDIRQEATKALGAVGYFDNAPPVPEDSARPFAGFSAPQVSRPMPGGLFRGISKAGTGGRKPPVDKPRVVKASAVSLKDLFGLATEPEAHPSSRLAEAKRREGVSESSELRRVLQIRRRPPALASAPDLTEEFRKPGGTRSLWPIQSAALQEARQNDGLLAPLGVGSGKTLISLLLASAMRARKAVILVPPGLRSQLIEQDIPSWARHFRLPLASFRIVAYSQLSNAKSHDILEDIGPDLIIADEAHNLRHRTAARTKRFLRYMKEHPECRFACMSGTITRRSLKDYQHLSELALRKNSPLPRDFPTLSEWSEALDVSDDPMAPGALLAFCSDGDLDRIAKIAGEKVAQTGETADERVQTVVREAFRRRLVETPGVVATEEGSIDASLNIEAIRPAIPAEVQTKIRDVRTRWEIDGDELVDALSVARVSRQLAAGFRYRWAWPDGIVDDEWVEARREWNREVREILKLSRKGLDSPMLIASACERGDFKSYSYEAWRKQKHKKPPPVEAVWISDFLVKHAVSWAKENGAKADPLIIWYLHDCVGRKIAEVGNFPFFGPGAKASEEIVRVDGAKVPIIVASIAAHGTGKNLQTFRRSLITTPPPGGVEWEQMLGRTHRPGQLADEVNNHVYVHTIETEGAFRNAVRDANYIEQTTGQKQKLNYAEKIGFKADAFVFSRDTKPETEGLEWTGSSLQTLFQK